MVHSMTPSEDAVVAGQQKLDLVEDSAEMDSLLTPMGIFECMAHVMMCMTILRCVVTKQPLMCNRLVSTAESRPKLKDCYF
jgi:hypothetical protein